MDAEAEKKRQRRERKLVVINEERRVARSDLDAALIAQDKLNNEISSKIDHLAQLFQNKINIQMELDDAQRRLKEGDTKIMQMIKDALKSPSVPFSNSQPSHGHSKELLVKDEAGHPEGISSSSLSPQQRLSNRRRNSKRASGRVNFDLPTCAESPFDTESSCIAARVHQPVDTASFEPNTTPEDMVHSEPGRRDDLPAHGLDPQADSTCDDSPKGGVVERKGRFSGSFRKHISRLLQMTSAYEDHQQPKSSQKGERRCL